MRAGLGEAERRMDRFTGYTAIIVQAKFRALLGRRNSFTGRLYGHDPTVMSWELADAPRPPDMPMPLVRQARGVHSSLV